MKDLQLRNISLSFHSSDRLPDCLEACLSRTNGRLQGYNILRLAGRNAVARKKVSYIVRGGIPLNILRETRLQVGLCAAGIDHHLARDIIEKEGNTKRFLAITTARQDGTVEVALGLGERGNHAVGAGRYLILPPVRVRRRERLTRGRSGSGACAGEVRSRGRTCKDQ